MAPRDAPKETVKVQRTIVKSSATKKPALLSCSTNSTTNNFTLKRRISIRKTIQQTPVKVSINNTITMDSRQRTNTVPAATPKKENKAAPMPGSVTKSAKKSWKRRPKPAHSGVPVPEKMKQMIQKQLMNTDSSL